MDVPRDQTWVVEELADMIERRVRAVPAEVLLQHACARSRTLSTIIQPAAMIVASWQCLHTGHYVLKHAHRLGQRRELTPKLACAPKDAAGVHGPSSTNRRLIRDRSASTILHTSGGARTIG